jgi:hypothetical protein
MSRTRILTAPAVLLVAGCAAPSLPENPSTAPVYDPTLSHLSATAPTGTDTVVYGTGQTLAFSGVDTDRWAYSLRAVQVGDHIEHGQVLVASSIAGRNRTFFGAITGGTFLHNATGGGDALLTALLTTGQTMVLRVSDVNSGASFDRFEFSVDGGPFFGGDVYHGNIRLMRSRPEALGRLPSPGFGFDPRIGLFIVADDLANEQARPELAIDPRVIEVTRPDPVIDFRTDDPAGITEAPGSDNNVPPL